METTDNAKDIEGSTRAPMETLENIIFGVDAGNQRDLNTVLSSIGMTRDKCRAAYINWWKIVIELWYNSSIVRMTTYDNG